MVDQLAVDVQVEVLDAQRALDLLDPALGRRRRARLLVDLVVGALAQRRDDAGKTVIGVGRRLRDAGDDQRRARLVDQDRVDLVHDAEAVAALNRVGELHGHVVAQVVEAELGVGAVGGVGRVRLAARRRVERGLDDPDRHAEPAVDRTHPLGVAAGQVVVDGDHVHPVPTERVQVDRRGRGEGLALAGLHLGDAPGVEHLGTDQLHVVQPHAHRAAAHLAHQRERVDEDVVGVGAVGDLLAQAVRALQQLVVAEPLELGLAGADGDDARLHLLDLAALAEPQHLVEQIRGHLYLSRCCRCASRDRSNGADARGTAPGRARRLRRAREALTPGRGRSGPRRRRGGGRPR